MNNLYHKIRAYLDRDFTREEIRLQNDGDGDYIKFWSDGVEKSKPTDEQLNALESEANDLETLNQVLANRKAEYPSIQDLVVALYDTEDKAAIDAKRAEIKLKYPKPGA